MARIRKSWVVVVQDESIFIYDVLLRKIWAKKGTKPVLLITGSHQRTVWYGALANNSTQFFRQYKTANGEYFLNYLKSLHHKYQHMILFIDRGTHHKKDRDVQAYLQKHKETIRVRWFPPGFPKANPMEECWKQGKNDTLGSTFYESFSEFKKATSKYYRTKKFKLDLYKYLCH